MSAAANVSLLRHIERLVSSSSSLSSRLRDLATKPTKNPFHTNAKKKLYLECCCATTARTLDLDEFFCVVVARVSVAAYEMTHATPVDMHLATYSGRILNFMPSSARVNLIERYYDDAPSPVPRGACDYNLWTLFESVHHFERTRLKDAYGHALDRTLRTRSSVHLLTRDNDGHETDSLARVLKIGVPLARRYITRWSRVAARRNVPMWAMVDAIAHVYMFERKCDGALVCYARVLENGIFAKISFEDVRRTRAAKLFTHWIKNVPMATASAKHYHSPASRFDTKCTAVLRYLYTVLNEASVVSTEAASLQDILRETYDYNEMYACSEKDNIQRKRLYRKHNDGRYSLEMSRMKSSNIRRVRQNTSLAPLSCTVANCSLVPTMKDLANGKAHKVDMTLTFYKNDNIVRMDDDDDDDECLAYNFCKSHGSLVASAWYVLNQRKIWTGEFYTGLKFMSGSLIPMFDTTAEALYAYFNKCDVDMKTFKRRCDASIRCVVHFARSVEIGVNALRRRQT